MLCIFFISLTNGLSYFWCVTRSNRERKRGAFSLASSFSRINSKELTSQGAYLGVFHALDMHNNPIGVSCKLAVLECLFANHAVTGKQKMICQILAYARAGETKVEGGLACFHLE